MPGRWRPQLLSLGLSAAWGCSSPSQPAASPTPSPSAAPARAPGARPAGWAQALERPGLPNLHRVSPVYFRGAQPTAEGMAELQKLGVRTVVNLRAVHSDRDEIGSLPLGYEHISAKAWHGEDEDVVRFLRIATDPQKQPVFVHCQHGADRTGTMTAMYRIVVQGWTKQEAIREMTQGDYGFHSIWKNLIEYVQNVDVEKIRRAAGLAPPPAQ
ncbi:MAG: tyrosine-protein phosphatase [Myxococcales bacterium]|nr:tyrosine-protein phosphatase [Myxococcales bacterium]